MQDLQPVSIKVCNKTRLPTLYCVFDPPPPLLKVVFACAVAACLGQQITDERDAKTLREQRFNNGDGRAGSAFATENQINFREETDANGNRLGQYSYLGDDGKVFTVKYSAGKDGFRILEGDHIPSGGKQEYKLILSTWDQRTNRKIGQ